MYGQRQEISNEEVDERGNREGSEVGGTWAVGRVAFSYQKCSTTCGLRLERPTHISPSPI